MRPLVSWFSRLLLLAVCAGASSAHASVPGAGFEVVSYEVELAPDFAARSVSGVSRIRVASTVDDLREVAFSPNALTITSSRVDGRPSPVDSNTKAIAVALPRPLARGRSAVLELAFDGKPKRGVTFGPDWVFTSYWACDWMICLQDAPGDKATLALDLRLAPGLRSLAPGRLRRTTTRNGLVTHVWRQERPYSPYLYGFAAGRFTEAQATSGGAKLSFVGVDATPEELKVLFASTADMVRFFETKAGLPLPDRRYAQLLTPTPEAQEAAGFSLIGRSMIAPILEDPKEDWVIAHELAHQWWGNLVTCDRWSEFWLNEGVTTFMVAAWKERRWGRAAYDREMDIARRRLDMARKAGFDVPLTFAGEYPSLGVRRAVQYSKGALFLDALRRDLGDEAFWTGLRRFTRDNAGGVVDSQDFQRAMEQASSRDLDALFGAWVFAPA